MTFTQRRSNAKNLYKLLKIQTSDFYHLNLAICYAQVSS